MTKSVSRSCHLYVSCHLRGNFFSGLHPSEEIALVVTDYDAAHGVLSITKARVLGIDKDVTKTGEDRRIRLCRRAITVMSVSSACEPCHSLSQAVHGAAHVSKLEPDDRAQSPVGG